MLFRSEACVQSVGARLALLWALVDGKHAAHRLDEIPWEDDLTPQVRNIMAAFDRSEMGQPRLIGCPRSVSFAHSADLAACATDTSALVGVDIESLNRCPACEARIAARYFSEREQARIAASTDPHLAFLRIWTRKEALGKARGTGLAAKSHLLDTEALSSDCFVEWQVSGHLITACIIAE